MPRPAFEIFRVIHSLSLSRPASSSLRRPRRLSPFLHTRRPNRSCRVTPRLHLSGPVGAIFLATRTFSSFCAVLRQARLSPSSHEQTRRTSGSSAARKKISADWGLIARFVLASSSQLIRWLRNSRSAILLRLSAANALRTDRGKLRFFRRPTSSAVLACRENLSASTTCPQLVPRLGTWILSWLSRPSCMRHQRLSITQLPRCSPQPLPLDLSALANLDPWAAYPHLLVKLLRSLVHRNNAMKFRTPPLDHTCRMHQGSWT